MAIVVVNAGASSIKISVFETGESADHGRLTPAWSGQVSWSSPASGRLTVTLPGGNKQSQELQNSTFESAVEALLTASSYVDADGGSRAVEAVGHRIVHGGNKYSQPVLINDEVMKDLRALIELAPAHEKANIKGIEVASSFFPGVPQVAVFDTAFHQTMPECAKVYAGPFSWYEDLAIRRYGFHGINHAYCADRAAELLGKPLESLRLITCHLGNGASLAGIKNGACRSTTMGYTPLAGLMMGTRSGSIDPGILLHLLTHGKYSAAELLRVLNQESGLKGISGLSGDMREILVSAADGNARAALAFDMYMESLRGHIGSLVALLGGVDALVFTGGVGENSYRVRQEACRPFAFLNMQVDRERNENCQPDALISANDSSVKVMVIRAQEDVAIAKHCLSMLKA